MQGEESRFAVGTTKIRLGYSWLVYTLRSVSLEKIEECGEERKEQRRKSLRAEVCQEAEIGELLGGGEDWVGDKVPFGQVDRTGCNIKEPCGAGRALNSNELNRKEIVCHESGRAWDAAALLVGAVPPPNAPAGQNLQTGKEEGLTGGQR